MKLKLSIVSISAFIIAGIFIAATNKEKTNTLDAQSKLEDALFSFAKTYGYIRYFYPGDEVADFEWDRFAWYGSDIIMRTSNLSIDNQIRSLFSPIVASLQIENESIKIRNIYQHQPIDKKNAVYWQHFGDGKERVGYPYMSMRVNRPARKLPESPNDFGSIRKIIDAKKYQRKKVRLTGKIKVDALYIGRPSLIISVKEFGKDRQTFSTDGQSVISGKWVTHEVMTQLPDSIEQIALICQSVTQTGGLSFDHLLLETENNGKWQQAEFVDFETVKTEELANEWRPFGPNQDITLQKDETNNSVVSFSRTLGTLTSLPALFDDYPEQASFLVKSVGSGWHIGFPTVMQQSNNRTIPRADTSRLNALRKSLSEIRDDDLGVSNLSTRIANIIILWNRLQHFHPDNPFSTADWESELKKAIKRSFTDKTLDDHRSTLTKMTRGLRDSHMTFYITALQRTPFYFPFKWEWVENKLVVTKVISSETNLKVGDIIEKVNGIPAYQYWAEIKSNVIGATEARQNFKAIEESLSGEKDSKIQLQTLSAEGKKSTTDVTRTISEFVFNKNTDQINNLEKYQQIKPGYFYVCLSQITWDDLKTHLEELSKAKGIIFDLRGYPSWKTIEIVSHFSKDSIKALTYLTPKVIYPDRSNHAFVSNDVKVYEPIKPLINAKRVFLTNGKAISYAEDFMQLIEYYQLATIVGDYTAGTTGSINMSYLFGGLFTAWTGKRVLKQDGTMFNGRGVKPDVVVKPTIKNIREGKDDYIEYVMKNIFN